MINKKGKTHVTPSNKITSSAVATNKKAENLLRQIKTENAIKDLAKSNRRMGLNLLEPSRRLVGKSNYNNNTDTVK
jgi:hypothetical protein